MPFELTIRGDSLDDLAFILGRNFSGGRTRPPTRDDEEGNADTQDRETTVGDHRTKEVEPELPAKKSSGRGKTKKDAAATATEAAGSTVTETSDTVTAGTTEATSTSDAEPVTFEDLRAEASSMMDSGKVDGKAIQEMLQERFGVKAFGPLPEESYPAAMEALRDLAA